MKEKWRNKFDFLNVVLDHKSKIFLTSYYKLFYSLSLLKPLSIPVTQLSIDPNIMNLKAV